ncbi:hypothetical protein GF371_00175 [Candidatus Woesearchaeota archaeon]|nr:hypothetical protein [Candidatus Woesearchaeota archaeon]
MKKSKLNLFVKRLLAKRTNKSLEDLTLAEAIYLITDNTPRSGIEEKLDRFQQQANRLAKRFSEYKFFDKFESYTDPYGYTRWRSSSTRAHANFRHELFYEIFRVKGKNKYNTYSHKDECDNLDDVIKNMLSYNQQKGDCVGLTSYFAAMCEWFGVPIRLGNQPKHIFPVAPNGIPFELSVWHGLGRRNEKVRDDKNYGIKPEIFEDYNVLFSTILNNRGDRFQHKHKIDRANKYYELAIKACPKCAQESIVNLASNLAIFKNKRSKANAMIQKLLLKWPNYAGLPWAIAAEISDKRGEKEEAIRCLEAANHYYRYKDDEVAADLAELHDKTGNYKDGISWFRKSVALKKDYSLPIDFKLRHKSAKCYYHAGQFSNARTQLNFAINRARKSNELINAYYLKARCYFEEEKYFLAGVWFKKAIREQIKAGTHISRNSLNFLWKCAYRIENRRKRTQFRRYVRSHATPEQLERLKKTKEAKKTAA